MSGFEIDEPFDLPVVYKGQEIELSSRLVRRGYSYKIHVDVQGQEVIFEPDEERNFRAMIEHPLQSVISQDIIHAIIEALEKHLR